MPSIWLRDIRSRVQILIDGHTNGDAAQDVRLLAVDATAVVRKLDSWEVVYISISKDPVQAVEDLSLLMRKH